jgi:SAM-dependent methyltransferase
LSATPDRVHIDQPQGGRYDTPNPSLAGWFATGKRFPFEKVVMRGPSGTIPFRLAPRPDVEAVYPGYLTFGFNCHLQAEWLTQSDPQIRLEIDGELLSNLPLSVAPDVVEVVKNLRRARAAKRQWCLDHARCPSCKHPSLAISAGRIECARCSTVYMQPGESINFLSEDLYRSSSLEETSNVSVGAYDSAGWDLIHRAEAAGGKVLDCGAGLKTLVSETIVNLEIIDMPSTDVLGVGQSLPFRDGSFDAVFSFAVLEHVSDPFACAREMVRVLKPNGQLYLHVPFLQPEHGYPNHFYNMTREGLRNLFPDLIAVRHEVPESGLPIFALHWIVSHYAAYLDEGAKEKFLSMTMRELISRQPVEYTGEEIVRSMAEAGKWVLACTTALLLTKPA